MWQNLSKLPQGKVSSFPQDNADIEKYGLKMSVMSVVLQSDDCHCKYPARTTGAKQALLLLAYE